MLVQIWFSYKFYESDLDSFAGVRVIEADTASEALKNMTTKLLESHPDMDATALKMHIMSPVEWVTI